MLGLMLRLELVLSRCSAWALKKLFSTRRLTQLPGLFN